MPVVTVKFNNLVIVFDIEVKKIVLTCYIIMNHIFIEISRTRISRIEYLAVFFSNLLSYTIKQLLAYIRITCILKL
jgi:hypothetical protein